MGLAEGFEVGIVEGQLFHIVVEFDGFADIGLGGRKVAPLCGIASQVELDEWIFRVEAGRIGKDFRSRFDGVAPTFCKSPGDKPASFVWMAGGETSGQSCSVLPTVSPLEEAELEFQHARVAQHSGGEGFQFGQSISEHAQIGVSDSRFGSMKVFADFWNQAHAFIISQNSNKLKDGLFIGV